MDALVQIELVPHVRLARDAQAGPGLSHAHYRRDDGDAATMIRFAVTDIAVTYRLSTKSRSHAGQLPLSSK